MHTHEHEHGTDSPAEALPDAATYWEARYADGDRMWSGRVNAVLADVVTSLEQQGPVGSALDLGCGEGGDVLWLASRGWRATGVDLSPTAAARGRAAAEDAGVADHVRFDAGDLATWDTEERFTLVTASFLQSWPVEIPRAAILRRATRFVAPGGHLLVTAHAAPPGELPEELRSYRFPTPDDDLAALGVGRGDGADAEGVDGDWTVVTAEVRPRSVPRDDGTVHDLLDSVVLVRRR
ncbi:class I SAM-dependent methyltransferase [Curtobacterium sp. VKM Ac-2865]|uniref:class I SAM-dependent methyltransferase n=1 Tax=Curtobacterium sp. VKM Ac-2865 TaxID=2783817 RepID=UPI00188D85D6|nr:class I SAM-dependent methyltransferase [Curtobacterium sp. VKM Ac-2865]MBF4583140.1 class I SAM-dependent methyltransferase [Curtobacterium sp. VKM Ac-2865]